MFVAHHRPYPVSISSYAPVMSTLSYVPTNWKGIKAAPQEEDEGYTLTTIYQCIYLMYSHCTKWQTKGSLGVERRLWKDFPRMLFLEAKLQIFLKRTENNLSKKEIRCVVVHEVCTATLFLVLCLPACLVHAQRMSERTMRWDQR